MKPWPIVDPGDLRTRVAFYSRSVAKDAETGVDVVTHDTLFATLWGEMNPQGSRKFWDASRFTTENLDTLSILYVDGIDETMQAQAAGRTFEVVNVQNVQKRKIQLMLLLRELK